MKSKIESDLRRALTLYLKQELRKQPRLTYAQLAERMQDLGIQETEASITNKLKRQSVSASFFFLALYAKGLRTIQIRDIFFKRR
jgi:Domain of unknown function (DUF6471)